METLELLLVEDSHSDAYMVKRILKKEVLAKNHEWLKDGAEAIDYLAKEEIPNISLVLLDIKLPKISGLDVLKSIKQNEKTKNIPVVMFSSSEEQKDIETAYKYGANGYITKPREFSTLKETIRILTKYWLNLNKTLR